jgi:hypothetical protein
MNIYFDTEFTGLRKQTTLISIGLISEDGKTFYGEFNDYDKSQCDDWINENVVSEMLYADPITWMSGVADRQIYGARKEVFHALKDWLQQFDEIQFVSDVCHYDMVLLIDLFCSAFDLPKNISAVCHDINQDIAAFYNCSDKQAFDKSREEILEDFDIPEIDGKKHNALYDAKVIRAIHKKIG